MSLQQISLDRLIKPAKLKRAGARALPILSMTMHEGLVDQASKFNKRVASTDTADYKVVRRNQLVVGFPIDEGVLSFQNLYDEAIVSPAYDVWDLHTEHEVDHRYLGRFLRSPRALTFYASKLRGTTARRRTLPDDIFLKLEVPLPSLQEQQRITEVLDRAESLRAKRHAALAQPDNLNQSIFLNLFGDPATNPNGWPTKTLEEVTELVTGYPFRSEEYVTNGESVRLCRGANVLPGRIDWSDLACWTKSKADEFTEFSLKVGDVVIAMDRPWISEGFKIARVLAEDCPALLVQRVARIRGRADVSNEYIFYLLNQSAFTRHCRPTETTVPHISPKDIRSFAFGVPPIELQREFAGHVAAIEKLKATHRASLVELDALFTSLQHRAFQGEL